MKNFNNYFVKEIRDGAYAEPVETAETGHKTVKIWDDGTTYIYQIPAAELVEFKQWCKNIAFAGDCTTKITGKNGNYRVEKD